MGSIALQSRQGLLFGHQGSHEFLPCGVDSLPAVYDQQFYIDK